VEYTEWKILRNILKDNSLNNVKQIGFEIHTPEYLYKFKKAATPRHATVHDYVEMVNLLKGLEKKNFRKFNHRRNPFCEYNVPNRDRTYSGCYEVHYINMNFVTSNYTVTETERKRNPESLTGGAERKRNPKSLREGAERKRNPESLTGGAERKRNVESPTGGAERKRNPESLTGGAERKRNLESLTGGAERKRNLESLTGGAERKRNVESLTGGAERKRNVESLTGGAEK
jgi:hypothetical protein